MVPEVIVRAVPHANKFKVFEGVNGIGPIPKDCDIDFLVTNASTLPQGSTIEWMVRNEGLEAETINDLGHRAGIGVRAHETSAYNGTHYMDCVVKRYGNVLGMRRIPVKIQGMAIASRNPGRSGSIRIPGRR